MPLREKWGLRRTSQRAADFRIGAVQLPFGRVNGWMLVFVTAFILVCWLVGIIFLEPIRFVVFNPRGKSDFEIFLAFGQLFGALALAHSPTDSTRSPLRWLAFCLLISGVGALGFGFVYPLIEPTPEPVVNLYGSLFVRTLSAVLLAIGLASARVPRLDRRLVLTVLGAGAIVSVILVFLGEKLPSLVAASDLQHLQAQSGGGALPGLTPWHIGLSLIPMTAGVASVWGAVRHYQMQSIGGWLVIAVTMFAGGQMRSLFWPSMYSSVLTTTSLLRFVLTAVIIVGGIYELRRLTLNRMALLANEQERVRQLEELSMMKRDFTSIVAHELGTPLAAIGILAQMIRLGVLPDREQQAAAEQIQDETRILQLLVRDIQDSADVESDDFSVQRRPVALRKLIGDAEAYARTLPQEYPLTVSTPPDVEVLADPERIGQVIRNLLNNAVRHTPAGTPITLSAEPRDGEVWIEVADLGPGIKPADRSRILEKFGRGQNAGANGRGLGLYLSQHILQAHGTGLQIESEPGRGAAFSFTLKDNA